MSAGTALRALSGRRAVQVLLTVGLLVAVLAPMQLPPFQVFQLTGVIAYAIALIGLNVLTGYSGQISLGHAPFFALGAYTAALLMDDGGSWGYLAAVPIGAGLCFVAGYLFGIPALRLRGLYLALVTLGLAIVTPALIRRFASVTGGSVGLSVPKPHAPTTSGLADDQWVYYVSLVLLVGLMVFARNLVTGRVGRALIALRDNETSAKVAGVNLAHYKTLAFAYGAAFAGIGGVIYTWTTGYVVGEAFGLQLSINFLAALVVGGLATTWGPIVGAAFIYFVPNYIGRVNDAAPGLVFGVLLIVVVMVAPRGLVGLLTDGMKRARRLFEPEAASRPGAGQRDQGVVDPAGTLTSDNAMSVDRP